MCGITGFVDYTSKVDVEVLRNMLGRIKYRGPDSQGEYISKSKNSALGIRRLSIIDLNTGDQPIKNEDGSVVVVYNGEIYNYLFLRKKLESKGHKFSTNSDTEVLVHLYEEYGSDTPRYLNGMFAFAIWDEKEEKLFMARDRSGIKPLYYFYSGDKLIFGSEVKTILEHPRFRKEINLNSLAFYLYLGYIPGEKSIFKNIYKLLPGHSLTISNNGLETSEYFELSTNTDVSSKSLDRLLYKSVKMQLHADVPVGVFLSGGLDSSLIAYYIGKIKKLKSFSIGFEEKRYDESTFAEIVAKKIGTDHHSELFKSSDVIEIFEQISPLLDEPFADPSLLPTYKVSKIARSQVKVVLSGDGADELFGGYPTYQAQIVSKYLSRLPSGAIDLSKILLDITPEFILNMVPFSIKDYPRKELASIVLDGLKMDEFERHIFLMRTFFLGKNLLSKKPRIEEIEKIIPNFDNITPAKKAQIYDFYTYLQDDFFFKVDRASMYNSLEVRVPYLDNDVIDFAFSTNRPHVNLTQTKIHLRELLRDKIPEVADRPKRGFGVPLAKWFREDLKSFARDSLDNNDLYSYVDKKKVRKIWEKHQKEKENNAGTIWLLIVLSGWLKHWLK